MIDIYSGNMVKCVCCGSYITYSDSDVKTEERGYGVMSYAGETYMAKLIRCPKCNNDIEVY